MTVSSDMLLGIDVGTQSAKCVVLAPDGTPHGIGQHAYDVLAPHPQWFEQDPAAWWEAVISAVRRALAQSNITGAQIRGIGLTGQMHGLVLVGNDHAPLRPAIIWMDRRSADLCSAIMAHTPQETLVQVAANQLSPGFAGASLAWLHQHEPDVLPQARAALQPKDYIALKLTGTLSSDPGDASATWLYDVLQGRWSETLARVCGVPTSLLPPIRPSTAIVGGLQPRAAEALGLPPDIPVVAGTGDQAALLVGVGVTEPGQGAITIGTGGQITVATGAPLVDPDLRLNTFCHALPDRWYTMGAILNGGMALRWWRSIVESGSDYDTLLAAARAVPAGSDGVIFVPYLEGERTPHMDPTATGAFTGLTTQHTQAHLTRAVLEGVAFAFRDCLDVLRALGPVPDRFVIGGGGSRGPLWRAILASVLGVTLQTVAGSEHTARGAALLAGIGTGVFRDAADAAAHVVRYETIDKPDSADHAQYTDQFAHYRALYPALRTARPT